MTVTATGTDPAPVRRRPKDRRQQILTAAAALFQRSGYDGVGMADIAAAVDVTPGAIYRHFPSKQDVLRHCLDGALGTIEEALRRRDGDDLDAVLRSLAGIPAAGYLGLMWTRDAAGLSPEAAREISARFDGIAEQVRSALARARGDLTGPELALVTWSVIAVFTSVSLYRARLPEPDLQALLLRVARAVVSCPLTPGADRPIESPAPGVPRAARRARIIEAAGALFGERGYAAVSMDDIGAEAGVSAALVYQYFENKAAVLWAVQLRGTEVLEALLSHDLRAASSPAEALDRVLRSYARFGLHYPHVLRNLTAGIPHLSEEQRRQARRTSHDYLHEWITLVQHAVPDADEEHARSAVHAAISVVHTAVRIPALTGQPTLVDNLHRLGSAVLTAAGGTT